MAAWRYEISLLVLKKYFTSERKLNSYIIGCVDIMLTMCSVHCICFYFFMDSGKISLDRPHLSLKGLCHGSPVHFV